MEAYRPLAHVGTSVSWGIEFFFVEKRAKHGGIQVSEHLANCCLVHFLGHLLASRYEVDYFRWITSTFQFIVKEPTERLDPGNVSLDLWEYALYIMALAFSLEGDSIRARCW